MIIIIIIIIQNLSKYKFNLLIIINFIYSCVKKKQL
ncbi:unnamed protein product [Schistosoma curassoni]|uniref:Uncharacterized protein n=1 Tax=Schistosoma curassoni TaxID=6186 RepID=A0A183JR07_9TREM|nr:unnamed protein product [Schistosoma curassoni]